MESYLGLVFAQFLDSILVEDNLFAIHLDIGGFLDGIGDHDVIDRSENLARGSSLGGDLELQAFQSLGYFKSFVLDLFFLVCPLAQLFGQDLAVSLGGEDGNALGDEEVACITGLHGHDVVFIS